MTQDELIKCGCWFTDTGELVKDDIDLNAFAKLVADKEREAWERKFARLQSLMDLRETQPNKPCCLAEREACEKLCEDSVEYAGGTLAEAIRARGQA